MHVCFCRHCAGMPGLTAEGVQVRIMHAELDCGSSMALLCSVALGRKHKHRMAFATCSASICCLVPAASSSTQLLPASAAVPTVCGVCLKTGGLGLHACTTQAEDVCTVHVLLAIRAYSATALQHRCWPTVEAMICLLALGCWTCNSSAIVISITMRTTCLRVMQMQRSRLEAAAVSASAGQLLLPQLRSVDGKPLCSCCRHLMQSPLVKPCCTIVACRHWCHGHAAGVEPSRLHLAAALRLLSPSKVTAEPATET